MKKIGAKFIWLLTAIFYSAAICTVVYGIVRKDELYYTAEHGIGYAMGVIGSVAMLLLLVYPLRKRRTKMRWIGSTRMWFSIHMFLGVFGPIVIWYHSGFNLGSFNSTFAIACMTIVAVSGILGRYFYSKIHHGLHGRRIKLNDMQAAVSQTYDAVSKIIEPFGSIENELKSLNERVADTSNGILRTILNSRKIQKDVRSVKRATRKTLNHHVPSQPISRAKGKILEKNIKKALYCSVDQHLTMISRIASFSLYERLFSAWHHFHLPLFVMLVITAIIHVFVVHIY